MRRPKLIALSLIFALATSACTGAGKRATPPPVCPQLPPPPASLMVEPTTETRVRAELFGQPQSAIPKSEDSRQSSGQTGSE